eukprot:TRINITY_DN2950_c0_g1_i1.p1 TRINITY_DN2950_c0_g1~~TRINITY_DN2950_c0_g1_i1.p1  ORF type:complete len:205 (-),score=70.23 TRINITY_DN2950_c0_g1_i1:93-707(-)
MQRIYPHAWHGEAKNGMPLYIDRIGLCDPEQVFNEFPMEQLMQHHYYVLEKGRELTKIATNKYGRVIDGTVQIFDLTGFGRRHMSKKLVSYLAQGIPTEQKYYPDFLYRLFFVGAPWIFSALWNMIKPWVDKETQSKVVFLGKDYKEKLLEYIDEDVLPTFLGGRCENVLPFMGDAPADEPAADAEPALVEAIAEGAVEEQKSD